MDKMLRVNNIFLLSLCILVFILGGTHRSVSAELTETDFKAMKIKDLRAFLDARGLKCVGCQEKTDFVRMAYKNREKKPNNEEHTSRVVPKGKFWEVWSGVAKSVCAEEAIKRGNDPETAPFSDVCGTISTAVDSFFMQHGRRISQRLKKTPESMLKTSYKPVYYDAGMIYLKRLVNKCFVSPRSMTKCESLGNVMTMMEDKSTDINMWLTNVGIENTNPMYDIIQSGNDGDL